MLVNFVVLRACIVFGMGGGRLQTQKFNFAFAHNKLFVFRLNRKTQALSVTP